MNITKVPDPQYPMPETPSQKKVIIKLRVPAPLVEDAQALAASEGLSLAEIHRTAWMLGLAELLKRSNQRILHRKLRDKLNLDLLDIEEEDEDEEDDAWLNS